MVVMGCRLWVMGCGLWVWQWIFLLFYGLSDYSYNTTENQKPKTENRNKYIWLQSYEIIVR